MSEAADDGVAVPIPAFTEWKVRVGFGFALACLGVDRKSTRLNSSHMSISYAVFCLKKKKSQAHSVLKDAQQRSAVIERPRLRHDPPPVRAGQDHTLLWLGNEIQRPDASLLEEATCV